MTRDVRCAGRLVRRVLVSAGVGARAVADVTPKPRTAVPAPSADPAYERATGDLSRLIQAAKTVADRGHYDTCDLELGLSDPYPCSCGIDSLRIALSAYVRAEAGGRV